MDQILCTNNEFTLKPVNQISLKPPPFIDKQFLICKPAFAMSDKISIIMMDHDEVVQSYVQLTRLKTAFTIN